MTGGFWLGGIVTLGSPAIVARSRSGSHVDGHGQAMSFWGGGAAMWILLLVVIGILVYFLTQNLSASRGAGKSDETPLEVLKKRYARGEITKEEFDRMKQAL